MVPELRKERKVTGRNPIETNAIQYTDIPFP